jgi:hypothetical protein
MLVRIIGYAIGVAIVVAGIITLAPCLIALAVVWALLSIIFKRR